MRHAASGTSDVTDRRRLLCYHDHISVLHAHGHRHIDHSSARLEHDEEGNAVAAREAVHELQGVEDRQSSAVRIVALPKPVHAVVSQVLRTSTTAATTYNSERSAFNGNVTMHEHTRRHTGTRARARIYLILNVSDRRRKLALVRCKRAASTSSSSRETHTAQTRHMDTRRELPQTHPRCTLCHT